MKNVIYFDAIGDYQMPQWAIMPAICPAMNGFVFIYPILEFSSTALYRVVRRLFWLLRDPGWGRWKIGLFSALPVHNLLFNSHSWAVRPATSVFHSQARHSDSPQAQTLL